MAEITIIPSVRLYKTGLKTTQADGNTRSIALRQGSLDGACAVYSTIIALMCLRQINYEDVDTSNGNIDKRSPKGRFLSKLLEQRGMNMQGWNLKTLFSLFDHLVVPVLKIVDFYYFTPLNTSKKVIYTSCILYPFVYYIATTIYGLASSEHYYPYWFMNPQRISYVWIVVFFISFLFLFLGIIYAFTQFMAYIRRKRADTQMPLIIE